VAALARNVPYDEILRSRPAQDRAAGDTTYRAR